MLRNISEFINKNDFSNTDKKIDSLCESIQKNKSKINSMLEKSGLSKENIRQVEAAPQTIEETKFQINKCKNKLKEHQNAINKLTENIQSLKRVKLGYEKSIEKVISPLANKLNEQAQQNSEEIKNISMRYKFNKDEAWRVIAQDFYSSLSSSERIGEQQKNVEDFIANNTDRFDGKQETITDWLSDKEKQSQALYVQFLSRIFKDKNNYKLFEAIKAKHLNDIKKYKLIEVFYDDVPVMQSSFGQRCTAVIVILLLFGNFPIIIDEPEAHLDSALIANYLVPLIKKTKPNRQIIFATHNANFVINGDAEKIFILDNTTGKTKITETTIEDLEHRKSLLKLEGGEQAFENRGDKFGLTLGRTAKG